MRLIDIDDISLRKTIACGGLSAKALWKRIQQQPTIEPKRGEWIADKENMTCVCSVCGADEVQFTYGLGEYWYGVGKSNFCPNCGADMRGADDE